MASYLSFLTLAALLVLVPGADVAVVTRNALAGGRLRGLWSAAGVATATAVQGVAAAAGVGALIAASQPVLRAVRWVGAAYLLVLAVQAFRSAALGRYPDPAATPARAQALTGWRQGFVTNLTNPKVLVFYLAVLPQFLRPDDPPLLLVGYALTHTVLTALYLGALVLGLDRLRAVLTRRRVRRGLDVATGLALVAFGARLALD